MRSQLARNSLLTLTANLSLAFSNWLLLVIITKTFSGNILGEVVLALSILSPLFLFTSAKLRTLLIVDLQNEYPVRQYFNARFMSNGVALLLVPILWWCFLSDISAAIVAIIALYKWCDAWCELSYSYLHRTRQFWLVAKSQTLRSLLSIVILITAAVLTHNILLTLSCWLSVAAVFAGFDINRVRVHVNKEQRQGFSVTDLSDGNLYRHSMALLRRYSTVSMALVLGSMFVYIPNYTLKAYIGVEAAGQFAAISYFLVAGSILITSLSQVLSPQFSHLVNQAEISGFFYLLLKSCGLGLMIGAVGLIITYFCGHWLLGLIYTQDFVQYHPVFNWIMAAAMMRYCYLFMGTAMNSLKLFKMQTQIYALGTLTVLLLCLWWVPTRGLLGAAQAMFVATCVELCLYYWRFLVIRRQVHLTGQFYD